MRALRGQALVLFALTLLLLAVMVMVTLSIGSKVRSRMDLQTVADMTAYSNAVATARVLNSVSVMNRVQVAHTASTIGTLSLISWATKYWRHVNAARDLFLVQTGLFGIGMALYCPFPARIAECRSCRNGLIRTAASSVLLTVYSGRVRRKLRDDVDLFNRETLPRWRSSHNSFLSQAFLYDTLLDKLSTPASTFAQQYTTEAKLKGSGPLDAPALANAADLQRALYPNLTMRGEHPYHAAQLVMGSRGHPFVPERDSPAWRWSVDISFPWSLPGGFTWVEGDNEGRGYLNSGWTSNPNGPNYGHPYGSYAHDSDDTTRIILLPPFTGCTIFGPLAFAIGLIGRGTGTAQVGPMQHPGIHNGVRHSFETFPPFYDYNALSLTNSDDLYGQPKNMSVMAKDIAGTRDPWDLSFTYHASRSSSGGLDSTAPAALTGGKQLAIGAGLAYYNRPGHWNEPPNLFAPYWRATLSRPTVDRPQPGDPQRDVFDLDFAGTLDATGNPEASNVYRELQSYGYRGFE